MEKILIKTETNQKQCYILNMALLTQYKLILVDSNNSSIKLIDLNSNSVTCELPQEKVPESITSVTGSKAAVTFPTNGTVQFIHRTLDRLNLVNKLDVGETCCGISCANEKLAVTFRFPPKLQVIDMNGGIISTVKDGPDGKDIFKRPTYITSSNHNIFVSDEVTKEVIKLNWQGEMTGKYASNSVPKGVTLKGSRDILLCLPYKKTIEQLAEDLKTTRTLLKVERPCAITWCGIKGKVYISCHNYNEEDNYIKVYKI
jgi:hypothetical protein